MFTILEDWTLDVVCNAVFRCGKQRVEALYKVIVHGSKDNVLIIIDRYKHEVTYIFRHMYIECCGPFAFDRDSEKASNMCFRYGCIIMLV